MDNAKAKSVHDTCWGQHTGHPRRNPKSKGFACESRGRAWRCQGSQEGGAIPLYPQSLEDSAQGDKTPAVVEWYRDNAPEEYLRRYSGRKTHLEDRRKERPRWVAPERGHNANDKVRNSQERETASRVSSLAWKKSIKAPSITPMCLGRSYWETLECRRESPRSHEPR
jgi:hypothetical protein